MGIRGCGGWPEPRELSVQVGHTKVNGYWVPFTNCGLPCTILIKHVSYSVAHNRLDTRVDSRRIVTPALSQPIRNN